MEKAQLLRQYPQAAKVLSLLSEEALQQCVMQTYPKHHTIVYRDEAVKQLYLVLRGEITVSHENHDGKQTIWMIVRAPAFIGDLELLAQSSHYAANVTVRRECTVLWAPAAVFVRELQKNRDLLWYMANVIAQKTFLNSHNRGYALSCSSLEKTAIFLLQFCTLHPPTETHPTVLGLTRREIACEIAVSTKTLERCVTHMKQEGQITVTAGKITVSRAQYQRLRKQWYYSD